MVALPILGIIILVIIGMITFFGKSSPDPKEEIQKNANKIKESLRNTETVIPEKYIYPNGVSYIEEVVKTGRAKTLPEAIDKLELEEHLNKIESNTERLIRMQALTIEAISSIRITTWISYY